MTVFKARKHMPRTSKAPRLAPLLPEEAPALPADLAQTIVYIAAVGFVADLVQELTLRGETILACYGELLVVARSTALETRPPAWIQNSWLEPVLLPIHSITDAATQLRALQRNWVCYPLTQHRRAALITDKLPHVAAKPLTFGAGTPTAPLGSWCLWTRDSMLASASCSSVFPNGVVHFVEDSTPPSRAYLKLWEALTLLGEYPQSGDLSIDLGSSPGGWSWVLASLGARVFSIDKAELAPNVAQHPLVDSCRGSAFALEPQLTGFVDWLVCDVICYPEKLFRYMQQWIDQQACGHIICTLKFQGETDHATAHAFASIPNSRLVHLSHNKHELTWLWCKGA